MTMNTIVTGKVYALDPIFSPHGYAKKVFGPSLRNVDYEVSAEEPTCMIFRVRHGKIVDLEQFVSMLVPDVTEGRRVELDIHVST